MKKIAIIGAGPAGLACAIQLKRFGYAPLIFDSKVDGSLLRSANLVENYPGFPKGISGPELLSLIRKQAEQCGVKITAQKVENLDWKNQKYQLDTQEASYHAEICVIATGTEPIMVGEYHQNPELAGQVFYEVYDLKGTSGLDIGIVGAGDAAFDYALNLADAGNKVRILNRGTKIKSLNLLVERAFNHPSIHYLENHRLDRVLPATAQNPQVEAVFNVENSNVTMSMDCIIFAAGRKAKLELLDSFSESSKESLERQGKLFFIGDVANGLYRQTSIATGDGIRAAMQIHSGY